MGEKLNKAILPDKYDNYVFDLYGTLVDIHTDEEPKEIWDKLALFYGYYGACYSAEELKKRYETLVKGKEADLKVSLENDPHMHMNHHRRLRLQTYFNHYLWKRV